MHPCGADAGRFLQQRLYVVSLEREKAEFSRELLLTQPVR